jgi:TolB-like protein
LNYRNNSLVRKIRLSIFSSRRGKRNSSLKILLYFFAGLWLSAPGTVFSADEKPAAVPKQGPYKVAILPVAVHSPENIEFMREGLLDMLSSRVFLEGRVEVLEKRAVKSALAGVSAEIDAEKARDLGARLKADYVVFGSLTKLGDSASLDLKVLDVSGEKAPASVFVQAAKMAEIINAVDEISRKIDERILGYSLLPPAAAKVEKPPAEAPAVSPGPGFRPYGPGRPLAPSAAQGLEFWQSRPLSYRVRGLAVGDLDGDGQNEIVMIGPQELNIYRLEKGELKLLKRHAGRRVDNFLAVEVGDVNRDGKAEIFVTNFPADTLSPAPQLDRLASFAATFRNGEFKIEAADLDWFLRIVEKEAGGPVLLGQRKGVKAPFEYPIVELEWDGRRIKEGRKTDLPGGISVFGYAPLEADGKSYSVFIDTDFRLKVAEAGGRVLWKSQTTYGSDISFRAKPLDAGIGFQEGDEFAFINVRLMARGNEILVIRNISPIGQFFKRQKYYTGGEIQSLVWTGAILSERWRSQEISGYVADFQVGDVDVKGARELLVAVNLPRESILSREENSALLLSRFE